MRLASWTRPWTRRAASTCSPEAPPHEPVHAGLGLIHILSSALVPHSSHLICSLSSLGRAVELAFAPALWPSRCVLDYPGVTSSITPVALISSALSPSFQHISCVACHRSVGPWSWRSRQRFGPAGVYNHHVSKMIANTIISVLSRHHIITSHMFHLIARQGR